MEYEFNECQSSLEELKIYDQPQEIQEQFFDYINNVPFIQWMISKDRPHAKDLPRDEKGRIIFDVVHPPILDNMDYFRQEAIKFNTDGYYTQLRPNSNPNSEFRKFWDSVLDRSWHGMVRESDGMWIPGDMYFYLNFDPIIQTKITEGSNQGERVVDFPECWDGVLFRYFYIYQARYGGIYNPDGGLHGCEISSRGKSKSYGMASMIAKRFVIGEDKKSNTGIAKKTSEQVRCLATAYQKQYLTTDGILNKFQTQIDFLAQNTPFPRKRLKSSLQDMSWVMGYVDLDTGTRKGTLNEVAGLSAKDDPGKVRGKRQNLIVVEEFGSFANVLEMYNIMRPSVEEGKFSFGQMYLIGTAGEDESDFQGAQEIVYNPKGYKMYALPNVYDKLGQGRKEITYFFPGYLSRKGCYDENGNSNVTKALLEILIDRYTIKYNSSDINSITRAIAEIPITPQEAITRTRGNMFPVTLLNERINEIDNNPTEFDTVYTGMLQQKSDGSVEFVPTTDVPIREFPTKDNKVKGCIEIFEMPQKDKNGKVFTNRYILGHDPVDNDGADTMSLSSTFVLDLFTDKIVAEYTGRQDYADDNFEIVRLLCLFYNGKCLYENNKRGIFAYFSSRRCLHLLADTPDYLVDKQLIKFKGYGNSSKGVAATKPINDYANTLVREWLIKPVTITVMEDGEEVEKIVPNLHFIRNRALLKELVLYNPDINVDRLRSLGMVMLYRGQFVDMFEGNLSKAGQQEPVEEDDYFKHYDEMIKVYEKDFN